MFKYPESLSWTEGIFLRPHHFQQAQLEHAAARASDRALALPYAWGLYRLELDEAALEQFSFSPTKLQAILPGGAEVDLPGNAQANALDLSAAIRNGAHSITIYAAAAPLREGECNLAEEREYPESRRYAPALREHFDLNAGGDERPVMHRSLRVLFCTEADAAPGYEKMPISRLEVLRDSSGKPTVLPDREFCAPSLCLSGAPELSKRLGSLCIHLEKIGLNLISSLRNSNMAAPEKQHIRQERMLKAGMLRASLATLQQICSHPSATPFAAYTELCRLSMQLAAFRPLEDYPQPAIYEHLDCMPAFAAVLDAIYRLTSSETAEWCVRVDLQHREDIDARVGSIDAAWLPSVRAVYVGVDYNSQPRRVADMVEAGDTFKLTAASLATSRVRGVRLVEERYPSPLLPTGAKRLWFRAERPEADDIWQDISDEKRCALAWSPQTLPGIEAQLFLILCKPEQEQ